MIDDKMFQKFTITFNIFSLILSIFFVIILNKNPTSYGKLVERVVISEAISIFCILLFILEIEKNFNIDNISMEIFNFLTFNIFADMDFDNLDKSNANIINLNKIMIKFNVCAYYSTEIFSILMSIFICFEIILVLKNPIAQIKSRVTIYFAFSYFLSISVFLLNILYKDFDTREIYNKKDLDFDYLYRNIFYSDIGV